MTGIPTADEIEAAKAALQANLPQQAKKQEEEGSSAGEIVEAAVRIAYDSGQAVAVLLSQRLIGAKVF